MDKLKEKWRNLSKKLAEDNKEVQKNIRRAWQGEPQAFAGQGRALGSSEPAQQVRGRLLGAGPAAGALRGAISRPT